MHTHSLTHTHCIDTNRESSVAGLHGRPPQIPHASLGLQPNKRSTDNIIFNFPAPNPYKNIFPLTHTLHSDMKPAGPCYQILCLPFRSLTQPQHSSKISSLNSLFPLWDGRAGEWTPAGRNVYGSLTSFLKPSPPVRSWLHSTTCGVLSLAKLCVIEEQHTYPLSCIIL